MYPGSRVFFKQKYHNCSSENYRVNSREILQYITYAGYRNVTVFALSDLSVRKLTAEEIRCVFDDNSKIIFVKSS